MNELKQVDREIAEREPTWWEEVKSLFKEFILDIERNMPQLARGFLGGFLQAFILQGLSGFFQVIPQLPAGEDDI